MASAFITAMNTPLTKSGVKGADVYTEDGVGHPLVALSTMLVRGLNPEDIRASVQNVLASGDIDMIRDLWVLAFQTRDIRGGKGERDLFYCMITEMLAHAPAASRPILELVPEYGCWRDLWKIYEDVESVRNDVHEIVAAKYADDLWNMRDGKPISLLAKWIPREGAKTFKHLAYKLAAVLFPSKDHTYSMMRYRKAFAALNKHLKTVEINMCGGKWADIHPGSVPGRNLKLHTQAFLNKPVSRGGRRPDPNALRFPDNEDRMDCRANFQEHFKKVESGEATVKGAHTVMPHEIVQKIDGERDVDTVRALQGQWASIRDEAAKSGGLRRVVPVSDVSGSMAGVPMEVSIALGILVSELNHHAFRDHVLTFHTDPTWVSFKQGAPLVDKVAKLRQAPWDGNTNFQKAMDMILRRLVEHRVPVGEEPDDIIVFTDMGWDAASNHGVYHNKKDDGWETHLEMLHRNFKEAGEKVWGAGNGWKVPRIIVWNLRDAYKDFHAKATTEGVVMLSGWSPAVLKAITGPEGVKVQTPLAGLRAQLDDPRYNPVRAAITPFLS
jgi:hypothetical protein